MSVLVRSARMLIAIAVSMTASSLMTPLWLIRGLFLRKKVKGGPNTFQFILNGIGRELLKWQAIMGAQPGPYTRKPTIIERWMSPSSSFVFIEPAGKVKTTSNEKSGFDDSMLPVRLDSKEWDKETAAFWYRNKKDTSPISKRKSPVALYFHGGAYITLDADDIFMGVTAALNHACYAKVDVLSVAYRLAPGSKFPSQLYEAYSAFSYLKKQGYQNIIIGGDSAGANLAMTLWRYLDEVTQESSLVNSLVLFSPWLDMNGSKRKGFQSNIKSCVITDTYTNTGMKQLQTNNLPLPHDPWISPIHWSSKLFTRLPSMFMSHGGVEALVEEGLEFVHKAKRVNKDVEIQHSIKGGYPHDYQALPWFPYASRDLFIQVGQFVKKNQK